MAILIDGYNLLHASGVFARAVGPGSLEKLHEAFLEFLATSLDPAEVPHTTVVFDARGRTATRRRSYRYGEITVHYASRDEDADTYLAELIAQHTAPRKLVVVSSDHQVQRAARRRRAQPIDSEIWYADLVRARRARSRPVPPPDAKPAAPLSPEETAYWLAQFSGDLPELSDPAARFPPVEPSSSAGSASPASPAKKQSAPRLSSAVPPEPIPPPAGDAAERDEDVFPASYLQEIEREIEEHQRKENRRR